MGRTIRHALAVTALVTTTVGPAGASSAPAVSVLPGLGGSFAAASAVNDAGVVVGSAQAADGRYYAVQWSGGRISRLPDLGGSECQARDVDDSGRIVGGCVDGSGTFRAVIWVGGRLIRIPAPGSFSMANATSKAGVVGTYNVPGDDPFRTRRAFLWTPGATTVRTITAPIGASAEGINDGGRIVGTMRWSFTDPDPLGTYRGWIWREGSRVSLGTLGGGTTPNDINNRDQVVGTSVLDESHLSAFVQSAGRIRALASGPYSSVTAQAINDGGVVVGTVSGAEDRAARWASPTAPLQVLAMPSGSIGSQAQDINASGTIVGLATSYDGSRFSFRAVAWR